MIKKRSKTYGFYQALQSFCLVFLFIATASIADATTYTEKPIKYARINYSGGSTKLSDIDDVVIVGLSGMFYGGSGSIGPVAFDVTVSDGGPTDFIKVMESTNVSSAPYYHNLNRSFSVPVKIPKGTSVTVTATQLDSKAYNVYLKDIGVYFIEMPL